MSVAIGMPHPLEASPEEFNAKYRIAGITIPPRAAMAGRAAARKEFNAPVTSSRLISRPTTKKNRAINASLTNSARSSSWRCHDPTDNSMWECQRSW
jgi:hypothetical protein